MDVLLSIMLGIALSAACGFRVFVPFLIVSIAAMSGQVELAESFAWIGTWPALIVFAVATAAEIGGYYFVWLDNLLDTIAGPAAVVAGVLLTASVVTDVDPTLRWTLAIIAGGGAAATVQATTTAARLKSTVVTAGMGNVIISTVETALSLALSILAVAVPLIAGIAVLAILFLMFRILIMAFKRKKRPSTAENPPDADAAG
jgi:hypothetical protein